MSLHVNLASVITNENGHVLLVRREDLGGWGLPAAWPHGDAALLETAALGVHDATGLTARFERAAGVYFWPGLATLTIVCAGSAVGGSRGSGQFFAPVALPAMPAHQTLMALDALAQTRHRPRVLDISAAEQQRLRFGQSLRRFTGRLRGQGGGPAPLLDVQAVAVVMDEGHRRVLTLRRKRTEVLPRVVCAGQKPPWDELAALIASEARVPVSFRWAGVWQDRANRRLDLVFAATASETFEQPGRSEWSLARQVALPAREAQYISRVRPSFARDPIWIIDQENSLKAGDTIPGSKESER